MHYAKIVNGELWVRQKHKDAPWKYVCHEREIGKAPIKTKETIQDTKQCLKALGDAWRGDYSFFCGRTLKSQLQDIELVLDGEMTAKDFMDKHGIIRDLEYSLFKWKAWL